MVKFQVEHIISLKHGGKTTLENLTYACPICKRHKRGESIERTKRSPFRLAWSSPPRLCLLTKRKAYNKINLLTKSIITPCPSCLVERHKQGESIERTKRTPFPTFPQLYGQKTTASRASKFVFPLKKHFICLKK